jgi:uncharacterized phage-associated protein
MSREEEQNVRIYRKDRDTFASFGAYNEPMKDIIQRVLKEYQDLKAKQLFDIQHGRSKVSY